MNNNSVVVAWTLHRHETISALEIEFDTQMLMSWGAMEEGETLSTVALENLALSQTLDDLQKLVWP